MADTQLLRPATSFLLSPSCRIVPAHTDARTGAPFTSASQIFPWQKLVGSSPHSRDSSRKNSNGADGVSIASAPSLGASNSNIGYGRRRSPSVQAHGAVGRDATARGDKEFGLDGSLVDRVSSFRGTSSRSNSNDGAEPGISMRQSGRRSGKKRLRRVEVVCDAAVLRDLESLLLRTDSATGSAVYKERQERLEGGMTELSSPSRWDPEGEDASLAMPGVYEFDQDQEEEGSLSEGEGNSTRPEGQGRSDFSPVRNLGVEGVGGRRVLELVAAWDVLLPRLPASTVKSSGAQLLLAALKLAVPALQEASPAEDGRQRTARALAIATTLADLRAGAEAIAAGLLREAVEVGNCSLETVEERLGMAVGRLVHDTQRVSAVPGRADSLDDEQAAALRQFCLGFHDVRAVLIELAARLDTMRHLSSLPRWRQQVVALETLQLWAPLAHALGTGGMMWELEDAAFRVLFPQAYSSMASWLNKMLPDGETTVETWRSQLQQALEEDLEMKGLASRISVMGRCKSLYSTMKKLLVDGRGRHEVHDLLGLRCVIEPLPGSPAQEAEWGERACYIARRTATEMWPEVPGRAKDYIATPKKNGYQSLHLALRPCESSVVLELQIRTEAMDVLAVHGAAAHGAYKGGLTDPHQVQQLKAIVEAAAELASVQAESAERGNGGHQLAAADKVKADEQKLLPNGASLGSHDHMFSLFDRDGDGLISVEEVQAVMGELRNASGPALLAGETVDEVLAGKSSTEDARELMALLDLNTDGSVSADEFEEFRRQVRLLRALPSVDKHYSHEVITLPAEPQDADQDPLRAGPGTLLVGESETKPGVSPAVVQVQEDDGNYDTALFSSDEHQLEVEFEREVEEFLQSDEGPEGDGQGGDGLNKPIEVRQGEKRQKATLLSRPKLQTKQMQSFRWLGKVDEGASTGDDDGDSMAVKALSASEGPLTTPSDLLTAGLSTSASDSKAGEQVPNDVAAAMLAKVRQLIGQGAAGTSSARSLLQELARQHSSMPEVWMQWAQLERKLGNTKAACKMYERAVVMFRSKGPQGQGEDLAHALQAWGNLEAAQGFAKEARQLFLESIQAARTEEMRSGRSAAWLAVAGLHSWALLEASLGNWVQGRDLLERAEQLQPDNAVVLQARALLEAQAHNYTTARAYFSQATKASPKDPACWQAWALFEGKQGRLVKMRSLMEKALQAAPSNLYTLQAWAHQEARVGTPDSLQRARQLFRQSTLAHPQSTHAWQAWGVMEHKAGNVARARRLFEQCLAVQPSCVPALVAYARLEKECGNHRAGQGLLAIALEHEPDNAAALMEVALAERQAGNETASREFFVRAAATNRRKSRVRRRIFESRKNTMVMPPTKSTKTAKEVVGADSRDKVHSPPKVAAKEDERPLTQQASKWRQLAL